MKSQAGKALLKKRVNLGLAFSSWQALTERMGMKSDVELTCFLLDRGVLAVSLVSLPKYCFYISTNVMFLQ